MMNVCSSMLIFHYYSTLLLVIIASYPYITGSAFLDVTYISFSMPNTRPLPTKRVALSLASKADDSPFQRIQLPWAFNFFGMNIYNVFASPNGALHYTSEQPCVCNCFAEQTPDGGTCDFNQSYKGVIAGFLTDLDPSSASKHGNMTYYKGSEMVSVVYSDIPLFDTTLKPFSFRISLYNDSRVEITYDSVFTNQTFRGALYPQLISGLRPMAGAYWNVTAEQRQMGLTQWYTSLSGVYPYYNDVKSGNQFTACPFSQLWAAQPRYIDISIKTKANLRVTLIPLLMSCGALIDVVLYINEFDPNSPDFASCRYINSQGSNTGAQQSLQCDLSTLPVDQLKTGETMVRIAWRARVSGSNSNYGYKRLDVKPIPVTFYSSNPADGIPGASTCALNLLPPTTCTTPDKLCSGDYSCLRRPCTTNQQTSSQQASTLFQYPTCAAARGKVLNASCSTDLAYNANLTKCCSVDQQDCGGVCFGTSKLAVWTPSGFPKVLPTHRTLVCCPPTSSVDCAGNCIAKGKPGLERDACGRCGGNDKKGLGCSTGVTVTTGWGYNKLYYFIDYSSPSSLWAISPINISNANTTSIMINFSLSGNIYSGPDVSLNIPLAVNIVIPPRSSLLVPVNFSMQRVFRGSQQSWSVKTLIISYWRPSLGTLSFNYPVESFPQGSNCSAIQSAMACVRAPACILCPRMRQQRVLGGLNDTGTLAEEMGLEEVVEEMGLEEEGEQRQPWVSGGGVLPMRWEGHPWWTEGKGKDSEEWDGIEAVLPVASDASPASRVLYTGLVPNQLSDVDDPQYVAGVCVNGFLTDDCPFSAAHSSGNCVRRPIAFAAVLFVAAALYY